MTRRRFARDALLGVVLTYLGVLSVAMADSVERGTHVAGVVTPFTALISLTLSIVALVPAAPAEPPVAAIADDLAATVEAEWLDEVAARGLRQPGVLPLSWSTVHTGVSDPGCAGEHARLRLDGRMAGDFATVVQQLARGFQAVPLNRMVILGEPGAGKTVLAMLLTVGLLGLRDTGGRTAVPVLLTASTWDPVADSMDDWIVRVVAQTYYDGVERLPRKLLGRGLLLPIVDGLDEIPESSRQSAVRAINRAIGADRPIVVTCRSAEYTDVIAGGAPTLRRTPVVEVSRLAVDDIATYLGAIDWPERVSWAPVLAAMRAGDEGPLRTALSTPLMVSIARRVYARTGDHPSELLDRNLFDSRFAVEDHLLDRFLIAATTPGGDGHRWTWNPARTSHWLTYLARYLHRHGERDLAWWRMADRLLPRWAGTAVALGPALIVFGVMWGPLAAATRMDIILYVVLMFAVPSGALTGAVWYASTGRTPGRLAPARRGSLRRLARGFGLGTALSGMIAIPVLVAAGLATAASPHGLASWRDYLCVLFLLPTIVLLFGVVFALQSWLTSAPGQSGRAGPSATLRSDRTASLVGSAITGTVFGALLLVAIALAFAVASLLFELRAGWPSTLGVPDRIRWAGPTYELLEATADTRALYFALGGGVYALLSLIATAWFRFLVTRGVLAAGGRIPLRLMAFLSDARAAGLLRQSGGVYQFAHARLQQRLATRQPAAGPRREPTRTRTTIRRTSIVGVTIVSLAVAVLAVPHDASRMSVPVRMGSGDLSFSPDGREIVGLVEQGVRIWPRGGSPRMVRLSDEVRFLEGLAAHGAYVLGFTPDGRAAMWNSRNGRIVDSQRIGADTVARLSDADISDERTAVAALIQDDQLLVCRFGLRRGCTTRNLEGRVDAVAISGDGRTTAVVSNSSGTVFGPLGPVTLDRETGRFASIQDIALSPDGRWCVVRDDYRIEVYQTRDGTSRWTTDLAGPDSWGVSESVVKFSPDGSVVIAAGGDGALHRWSTSTGHSIGPILYGHMRPIRVIAISPDGDELATSDDVSLRTWSTGYPAEGYGGRGNP
ncbi:hypothetical protein [Actinoplanes sp. NPDC051851]|uniref:NACHT and WD40 repeat domain-containing protein n=1 Tax=Actinoplanes sp. NPDC051851 TaxID=3154753 RepID=UPI0034230417